MNEFKGTIAYSSVLGANIDLRTFKLHVVCDQDYDFLYFVPPCAISQCSSSFQPPPSALLTTDIKKPTTEVDKKFWFLINSPPITAPSS